MQDHLSAKLDRCARKLRGSSSISLIILLTFVLASCLPAAALPASQPALEIPVRETPVQPSLPPADAPTPRAARPFAVRYHPDGPLYAGDQVSLEVIARREMDLEGLTVEVQVDGAQETTLGPEEFRQFGIGKRSQATLRWAWDTRGWKAGKYWLTFTIRPEGETWTEAVTLYPAEAVPEPEPEAEWTRVESECCELYVVTGTEAERDLPELMEMADEQAHTASKRLDADLKEPIPIVFLPRVLGHGGFASEEIYISYLDRSYAGSDPAMVLHHEIVHWLDSRLGGDLRPTLLVEGLAVYLTGGHFKPEPLMPRAAALLPAPPCAPPASGACGLDRYHPLDDLVDEFYYSQHEIGYLQAGALVEYMVETWGWAAFSEFYRNIHPVEGGSQAEAMDAALQEHFALTLVELDARFQAALAEEPVDPEHYEDVRLTIEYYDTVRRYQKLLDPSAHFLTAWLPDGKEMREREIVADFLRRPSASYNRTLENLLVDAYEDLRGGDTAAVEQTLDTVNLRLDWLSETVFVPSPLQGQAKNISKGGWQ